MGPSTSGAHGRSPWAAGSTAALAWPSGRRQEGFASHARHGTWIVDDGVEVRITGHLDGGHFRAWRKGWVKSVPGAAEALMQVGRGQAAEVREGSRSESDGSAGDDVDQSVAATVPVDADVSCDEWVAYELFT